MSWLENPEVRGATLGVIAAINIVIEALVAKGVVKPEVLRNLLHTKIDQFLDEQLDPSISKAEQVEEANVLRIVLAPLESPKRQAIRDLLGRPPEGSA